MNTLSIRALSVAVEDTPILDKISMEIAPGEVHVLMGPNGAGKSTLGNAIMGNPLYTVTEGRIFFEGRDITEASVQERARAGLFLSFQNPIEVPGLTLFSFLRTAREHATGEHIRLWAFRKQMLELLKALDMDESYLDRDLNVGFSGGEKKKAEILQLLTLSPRLAILDETDSGLDVDAVRTVSAGISRFLAEGDRSLLIITHSTRILEALHVDRVHVLSQGRLCAQGGPEVIEDINRNGFEHYTRGAL